MVIARLYHIILYQYETTSNNNIGQVVIYLYRNDFGRANDT
jgi:hypothetical protein